MVKSGKADVTFLAPTPDRLAQIDFAPPFMEMEITLIVPGDSPIKTLADADQPGRRIVVYERTANEETARKALPKANFPFVPLFAYKKAFDMIKAGEADAFVSTRAGRRRTEDVTPFHAAAASLYGRVSPGVT